MADLATLERALRNADEAGDEEAARMFASEIQKTMKGGASTPTSQAESPITRQNASIAKPGTLEDDPDGPVHKYVRPGLEALGMGGGIVLGSRLGPKGAAAGGALGYAGGDALSSLIERLAGERPHIKSLKQAGQETLQGVQTGGLMEMGGQLVGKVIPPLLAPFSKQFEGQNRTVREMAEERGITLDPHEVMQSRPLALGHKVLENVPFTSGMIQRSELEKLGALTKEWQKVRDNVGAPQRQRLGEIGTKIQDTVEKQLDKAGVRQEEVRAAMREDIMQRLGSPVSYKELGEQTQKFTTDLHKAKKDVENLAWEHAREGIPEGLKVENIDLKAFADKTIKEFKDFPSFLDDNLMPKLKDMMGSGNAQYDKLIETSIPKGLPPAYTQKIVADIAKENPPGWTVQSLIKLRSVLSDQAAAHHSGLQRGDATKGSSDIYGKVYTEAIKAIDKNLDRAATKSGSDFVERLKFARHLSGERLSFFNKKDNPAVIKAITSEAETLDRVLIKPGNAAGFTHLKEAIGDQGVKPIKQAFTNRLMGEGGKGADGLSGLRNTLDRYGRQTLAEVYSEREIKDLYHLADKSQWMAKSPIGNPFFRELVKSSPNQVAPAILSDANTTAKTLRAFPQMKQPLRQAFVDGVHPNEQSPFPTRLMQMLNSYPKEVQAQLFSKEEMIDFHQLARIIERTKGSVKLAENPSGTAQNLVTFTTAGAILKHPLASAPQVITTSGLAKLYMSKIGRKYLMEGLMNPAASKLGAEVGTKIGAILATDEADRISRKNKQPTKRTPITFDDEEDE